MELHFKLWLEQNYALLTPQEYMKRLESLGFEITSVPKPSHRTFTHPSGIIQGLSINLTNWGKAYKLKRGDMRRELTSRFGVRYKNNLDFMFENPFKIPSNLNLKTLKYPEIEATPEKSIAIASVENPNDLIGQTAKVAGKEKKIVMAGYGRGGIEIMFDDESVITVPYNQAITIKLAA